MMTAVHDAGFRAFAAMSLLERLQALTEEVSGVREARDVEPLHRMRVASRRLRSALSLFEDCLPKKRCGLWMRSIRDITRVLGEARDLDVQVLFLEDYLAHVSDRSQVPGPRRLRLRLLQKRTKIQSRVVQTLDAFERADIAGGMEAYVRVGMGRRKHRHPDFRSSVTLERAGEAIRFHSREVLGFEGCVDRPDDKEGLHAMRIANKRLRYAMEIFAPLYGDGLEEELRTVRRVHALLGDIHDCDVWADLLPAFIEEERHRTEEFFGHTRSFSPIDKSITVLALDRESRRGERYEAFRSLYHVIREEGFWKALFHRLKAAGAGTGASPSSSRE